MLNVRQDQLVEDRAVSFALGCLTNAFKSTIMASHQTPKNLWQVPRDPSPHALPSQLTAYLPAPSRE